MDQTALGATGDKVNGPNGVEFRRLNVACRAKCGANGGLAWINGSSDTTRRMSSISGSKNKNRGKAVSVDQMDLFHRMRRSVDRWIELRHEATDVDQWI